MEVAKSLQQIPSSYIREILAAACDKNVISLPVAFLMKRHSQ